MAEALYTLEKPLVVAVNGVAAGGGVGLALLGDIVIASESARFVQVFAPKLGLVPDRTSLLLSISMQSSNNSRECKKHLTQWARHGCFQDLFHALVVWLWLYWAMQFLRNKQQKSA